MRVRNEKKKNSALSFFSCSPLSLFRVFLSLRLSSSFPSPFLVPFFTFRSRNSCHHGPHLHEAVRPPLLEARDAHPDGKRVDEAFFSSRWRKSKKTIDGGKQPHRARRRKQEQKASAPVCFPLPSPPGPSKAAYTCRSSVSGLTRAWNELKTAERCPRARASWVGRSRASLVFGVGDDGR